MMPESASARRAWIERLIADRDFEGADSLIARGLLNRPTDAALTLLRARSLFAQARHEDAARELNLVLDKRPNHAATLVLAGRTALSLGRSLEAAGYFERAERRRPGEGVRRLLAEAWLDGHMQALCGDHGSVPMQLWMWHLAEEFEHRRVVHDVMHRLYGPERSVELRKTAGVFARGHYGEHAARAAAYLYETDRAAMDDAQIAASKKRKRRPGSPSAYWLGRS